MYMSDRELDELCAPWMRHAKGGKMDDWDLYVARAKADTKRRKELRRRTDVWGLVTFAALVSVFLGLVTSFLLYWVLAWTN